MVGALRMGSCLMGVEFQFGKMKTSGDSLNNSIAQLNCTLKMIIKIVYFAMYILL